MEATEDLKATFCWFKSCRFCAIVNF